MINVCTIQYTLLVGLSQDPNLTTVANAYICEGDNMFLLGKRGQRAGEGVSYINCETCNKYEII